MKRILAVSCTLVWLACSPAASAYGPAMTILTEKQLSLVRANCVTTKSVLERVRANDALVRINLGREYDAISTKLMAPMNSRIALNKLNGIDLTKTTVDFDRQIDQFRGSYQRYEQTMAHIVQMDCQDRPADFYMGIERARHYRSEVRKSVVELDKLINQYSVQLDKLDLSKFGSDTSGGAND
jgi:lipoprotein